MRVLVIAIIAISLAACGPRAPIRAPCPVGEKCLEYGNNDEPASLDPAKITGTWESNIVNSLFEGLTKNDATGRPIPGIAKSWETSADGKVWTFHLRNALWSDGTPLTADDFVFSLQRLLAPSTASEYASLMYIIVNAQAVNEGKLPGDALGAKAIDQHTLQITLVHPAPYLTQLGAHWTMAPVPKSAVKKWGDAWTDPSHMVVNGPYKLRDWAFGDHVRLVKNSHYYDPSSICFDQVTFYPTGDSIAAERRVRRGELDINRNINSNRLAFLRQPNQVPAFVHVSNYLGVDYLVFNAEDVPAMKDRRVRTALTMAIDREFLTKKLLRGGQQPAYDFVPPGVANYISPAPPAWAAWPLWRRQSAAKALLADAGFNAAHPLKIEIKHANSGDSTLVMPAVQADWRSIGVFATLIQEETQIHYQDLGQRDFQAGWATWIADYDDPMSFLFLMQSSAGPQNYGAYKNPAYDALLTKADNEPNAARRAAYLGQAEQIVIGDAVVAPLYFVVNTNLVNPQIIGWVDNIVNIHRAQTLCRKDGNARR